MEWKPTDVTISILFVYFWISTCFGPTGPSSGEFVQLFTQPLVPDGTINKRNHVIHVPFVIPSGTNGCVNSCTNSPEDGPVGPKQVEIQQYTIKIEIVTSVGFHSICWKDARYKKPKIFQISCLTPSLRVFLWFPAADKYCCGALPSLLLTLKGPN